MQHQQRLAQARTKAAARAQAQVPAQAIRARDQQERANAAMARADEAERKRYEREAKAASAKMRQGEFNENLALEYGEIDGLLAQTLDLDDHVDLEGIKVQAVHLPFPRWDLETPGPAPLPTPVTEDASSYGKTIPTTAANLSPNEVASKKPRPTEIACVSSDSFLVSFTRVMASRTFEYIGCPSTQS